MLTEMLTCSHPGPLSRAETNERLARGEHQLACAVCGRLQWTNRQGATHE